MPLPLLALAAGAMIGNKTKKEKKVTAVNGRTKKNGKRSKAHLRKAK
jgi:hypothetical protein